MPRTAPTQVIEHRLSLQDAERSAILPIAEDLQVLTNVMAKKVEAAQIATLVGAGVAVVGTYYVTERWAYVKELEAGIQDAINGSFWDRLAFGVEWSPAGIVARALGLTADDVREFFGFSS